MKFTSLSLSALALMTFLAHTAHATQTPSLPSLNECKVAQRSKAGPNRSLQIIGTRLEGMAAQSKILQLIDRGNPPVAHQDELGVIRYQMVTESRVLDSAWLGVGGCEGLVEALGVEVCTFDSTLIACETQCRFRGQEGFCP